MSFNKIGSILMFSYPPLGIGSGVCRACVDSTLPLHNSVIIGTLFNLFEFANLKIVVSHRFVKMSS